MTPHVAEEERATCEDLGAGLVRVVLRYGFAESPDVPEALAPIFAADPACRPETAGWFISRQTLVPSRAPGMALWRDRLFAALVRNAETPMTFFRLPVNRVMELGTQVEIRSARRVGETDRHVPGRPSSVLQHGERYSGTLG